MNVVTMASPPVPTELKLVSPDQTAEAPMAAPARLQAEPIGATLESVRHDLLRHGQHLAALIPEAGAAFVRDALRVLESQVCRIAVVGQVRSGKSSFINALAQRPKLLPTDVSPWATAVTRLHFGWAGAPEGVAAEFQLFEADEWDRLAHGSDRLRDLTHQLVPGFAPELLGRHIEAMRQRAHEQLGERLVTVLGARHAHQTLSADVLRQYLSAPASALAGQEGAGQFSEITKSAEIYLSSNAFPFPVTVIETPGIADPFLVRDELSRQALEAADVHICVVNARQGLTSADIAHLRILRDLHKERIVVFINRVDELADIASDVRQVLTQTRQTLDREFPGQEIPLVAGSALWCNSALAADQSEIRTIFTPAVVAYAKMKGALRPVEIKNADAEGALSDATTGQLARALSACSGLPDLTAALNQVLPRSHTAHLIRQVASYFAELALLNETSLRDEHRHHMHGVETAVAEDAAREDELKHIQDQLACIRQIAAEVERRLAGLQTSINDIVIEHRGSLEDGLMKAFDSFTQAEGERLLNDVGSGRAGRQWRCDTTPLRGEIGSQLQTAFSRAQARLKDTQHNVFPVLREAMLRAFPRMELPSLPAPAEEQPVMVMAAPLTEAIVLDGGRGLWPLGRNRALRMDEPDVELERALREEFVPTIEQLIRSAHTRLQRHAHEMSDLAARTSVAVMDVLRDESDGLIARAAVLLEARDARAREGQEASRRTTEQLERLAVAEALNRRLGELRSRCGDLVT